MLRGVQVYVAMMMHHDYTSIKGAALKSKDVAAKGILMHDVSAKGILIGGVGANAIRTHRVSGKMVRVKVQLLHTGSTSPKRDSSYLALESFLAEFLGSALLRVEQDTEKIGRSFTTHSL